MALNIIYAGRLDQEKGILSLIKALPSLLEKHKELYFHIYGSGQYHDEIEELSLHYPEHIFFYGWQKKSDFLTQWKQTDYMIMPSEFLETFGLTACESLLC